MGLAIFVAVGAGVLCVLLLAALAQYAWQAGRQPRVICLMYHRLASREAYERTRGTERVFTLPVDQFDAQVSYLKEHGYQFLRPGQLVDFVTGRETLEGSAVLLTFDDGCASIYDLARPVLERHQACATAFVTTDAASRVFAAGDPGQRRMTDDELRELDRGVVTVASHAVTHRPLRGMSAEELRAELAGSRESLEAIVGRRVEHFAVPGNWFDGRVLAMASQCGYKAVWCSWPGTTRRGMSLFGLPRINVEGQLTLEQFAAAISPWGIAKRRLLSAIKWAPGRLLGPALWLPMRKALFRLIPGGYVSMRRLAVGLLGLLLALIALLVWCLR